MYGVLKLLHNLVCSYIHFCKCKTSNYYPCLLLTMHFVFQVVDMNTGNMSTSNISNVRIYQDNITASDVHILAYITVRVLTIFAFLTNVFIIMIMTVRKHLRKNTFITLVLNLGLADTVVTVAGIAWMLVQEISPQSTHLCGITISLQILGVFMSVYFTFIISLNRYLSISRLLWNKRAFKGKRKYCVLYIPSAVLFFVNLNLLVVWKGDVAVSHCSAQQVFSSKLFIYGTYLSVLYFPLMFCTIIVYALALQAIRKHYSQVVPMAIIPTVADTDQGSTDVIQERKLSSLKTIGMMIILLAVLSAPFLVSCVLMMCHAELGGTIHVIGVFGLLINSAMNPIVYTIRLKEVREEIRAIFCPCQAPQQ